MSTLKGTTCKVDIHKFFYLNKLPKTPSQIVGTSIPPSAISFSDCRLIIINDAPLPCIFHASFFGSITIFHMIE
jgi:hypothetical protein